MRRANWEELNVGFLDQCRKRRERKLWGHSGTIGERFERDRERLLPLPTVAYEACRNRSTRAGSQALVRFQTNDYSVPVGYAHQRVLVKVFVGDVVFAFGSEVIARHRRSCARELMIFDPLHYLALLEQKTHALDQAAPLEGWALPPEFDQVWRQMEARMGKRGRREYVQVLRLMETFSIAEVGATVRQAQLLQAIRFER